LDHLKKSIDDVDTFAVNYAGDQNAHRMNMESDLPSQLGQQAVQCGLIESLERRVEELEKQLAQQARRMGMVERTSEQVCLLSLRCRRCLLIPVLGASSSLYAG